jgi:DNA-binding CsgD family transcriptional regulator
MGMPATACEAELRVLAGMFSDHRADLPAVGLPPSLLGDLADQVRCDALAFVGFDSDRRMSWFGQGFPVGAGRADDALNLAHWEHFWDCASCSYPDRSGDLRSITKISDFYSARQWHGTGMYADFYRPLGMEHDLSLSLPAPGHAAGPGRTVRLFLLRGPGSDFSERDRALLALLRPHLHQAYLDAEQRRLGTPQLTPRQRDLLRLVAAGYTNAQIARRLALAEGTVRKHLENIYGRLQVSSRTAAVTRAFPLPDPAVR